MNTTFGTIVLAGGSGYLGTVLASYFSPLAQRIVILSRRPAPAKANIETVVWDASTAGPWTDLLEGADLLVNLCGKNVNCRYTEANKAAIMQSRLEPTRLLAGAVANLQVPPRLWINITSATIYRHAEDRPQDEETGDIGYGFSIDVCRAWENAFFETTLPHTRRIALRMGIVFGRADGAFPRLLNLVKVGLGGPQGDGEQLVSWIHEQDAAASIAWLATQPAISGVVNCTAPQAIRNSELMALLRRSYGIPFGLSSPEWMLNLGARIIGTETELMLKSRWVAPKRLLDAGYSFQYPTAAAAVHDILSIRG